MKLYTDQGNLDWVFNNTVCGHSRLCNVTDKDVLTWVIASFLRSRPNQVSLYEQIP